MRNKTGRKAWLYRVDSSFAEELKDQDTPEVLDYIDMEVNLRIPIKPEPEDSLHRYYFSAIYHKFNLKDDGMDAEHKTANIAMATAVILDPYKNEHDYLIDICDADSGDLVDAYMALFGDDEELLEPLAKFTPSPICILEEFIVNEQFKLIQGEILKWVIKYLSNFSPILVTLPIPSYYSMSTNNYMGSITRDFDEEKTLILRRFFTINNFYPLRDTEYMYHIYNYSLD